MLFGITGSFREELAQKIIKVLPQTMIAGDYIDLTRKSMKRSFMHQAVEDTRPSYRHSESFLFLVQHL